MVNDTVAVLRDQVENLRAELANMKARREQDMAHVESLLKERDEWRALATRSQDQRDQWMSKAGELTEEVAGLRESIERADAAALSTIREVTKERDSANALLERWDRGETGVKVCIDTSSYLAASLSGTSYTNPRI